MIGYLSGKIRNKNATDVIIETNGVGYLCKVSLLTSEKIGKNGDTAEFFIHTNVREDDISLFAFLNEIEKEIFLKLISVSGIGAKMALAIQSVFTADELLQIVRTEQVHILVNVPGVGKKTAERLILELRDKFKLIVAPHSGDDSGTIIHSGRGRSGMKEEAIMALEALGYHRKKGEVIIAGILPNFPNITVEELIRRALKAMR